MKKNKLELKNIVEGHLLSCQTEGKSPVDKYKALVCRGCAVQSRV